MKTLTVLVGGQNVFQIVPGASLLMPSMESERTDVIVALRSALAMLSGDVTASPGDAVKRHVAHEPHQIGAAIIAMPVSAEENRGAAELAAPISDGPIAIRHAVDSAVLNQHDTEGDSLLSDTSELNGTHVFKTLI